MTIILGVLSMLFFALYALWILQGVTRLVVHGIADWIRLNRRY